MKNLSVKELSFGYNNKNSILRSLSFSIREQQVLYIFGHNGSGKTTLLKLISGLLTPQKGIIQFNNKALNGLSHNRMLNISYIPTNPELYFLGSTLEEEIFISRTYFGRESDFVKKMFDNYSQKNRLIESLSSGEKYKIAFLLGFWRDPDIVLLDEPFSLLDYEIRIEMAKYLFNLQKMKKFIIIWATNRIEETFYKKGTLLYLGGRGEWQLM